MQKIMFNDRYGLTQAVIEGRKTMTRRIEGGVKFQEMAECAWYVFYDDHRELIDFIDGRSRCNIHIYSQKSRYKAGEIVAVAQSYNEATREFPHLKTTLVGHDIMGSEPGCRNKMFVRADLMPHRIRITGIRCERLQDITAEECMKEGVIEDSLSPETRSYSFPGLDGGYLGGGPFQPMDVAAKKAFALLINKVSGRGTWERNPWVVVYEFELVK